MLSHLAASSTTPHQLMMGSSLGEATAPLRVTKIVSQCAGKNNCRDPAEIVVAAQHTVRVRDFERWVEATSRSPAEMVLKNRLREILAKVG